MGVAEHLRVPCRYFCHLPFAICLLICLCLPTLNPHETPVDGIEIRSSRKSHRQRKLRLKHLEHAHNALLSESAKSP